jgi:hypothetical protein
MSSGTKVKFDAFVKKFMVYAAFNELFDVDDMKAFLRYNKENRIDPEDIRAISKNPYFKKFTH